jgi:hypothetical protein
MYEPAVRFPVPINYQNRDALCEMVFPVLFRLLVVLSARLSYSLAATL